MKDPRLPKILEEALANVKKLKESAGSAERTQDPLLTSCAKGSRTHSDQEEQSRQRSISSQEKQILKRDQERKSRSSSSPKPRRELHKPSQLRRKKYKKPLLPLPHIKPLHPLPHKMPLLPLPHKKPLLPLPPVVIQYDHSSVPVVDKNPANRTLQKIYRDGIMTNKRRENSPIYQS